MQRIRLTCQIDAADGNGWWTRDITFPFAPYPGLIVGAGLVVKEVMVCQMGLDGSGTIEVTFHPMQSDDYLEMHGWAFHG